MNRLTREEFVDLWRRRHGGRCAHCFALIIQIDGTLGYLYVDSNWFSSCTNQRGMHWP